MLYHSPRRHSLRSHLWAIVEERIVDHSEAAVFIALHRMILLLVHPDVVYRVSQVQQAR